MSVSPVAPDPWGILAELRALRSEVSEQRAEVSALRAELRRREVSTYITQAQLAQRLGLKPSTLSMRLKRGGSQLAALAVEIDGRRAWRLADLEALEQGGAP